MDDFDRKYYRLISIDFLLNGGLEDHVFLQTVMGLVRAIGGIVN